MNQRKRWVNFYSCWPRYKNN